MKLYFIISNYQDNKYKISDFFTSSNPKVLENKSLELNFTQDDIRTDVTVPQLTLPDGSLISEHTHVATLKANGSYDKIYKIANINYVNERQIRLFLEDDPFIANYIQLRDTNINLTRSNFSPHFIGIHDIESIPVQKESTIVPIKTSNKLGKWAMFVFSGDVTGPINFRFDQIDWGNYEFFPGIETIRLKYPEVVTANPEIFPYYQMLVATGGGVIWECVYTEIGGIGQLKWVHFNQTGIDAFNGTFVQMVDPHLWDTKLNGADINVLVVVIPFASYYNDPSGNARLISYSNYTSNDKSEFLLDVKIIDGNNIYGNATYSNGVDEATAILEITRGAVTSNTVNGNNQLATIEEFKKTFDVSKRTTQQLLVKEFPPFKNHYLSVYGQRFKINPRYANNISIEIGINSGVVNFYLYSGTKENILGSGSFTHSLRYSSDKLQEFYQQNPTYKEQFNVSMLTKAIGLVTPQGAAMQGISLGANLINETLHRKGMELQPDSIYGDMSEVGLLVNHLFGIYWVVEIITTGSNEMNLNYDLNGFPTNVMYNINLLSYVSTTSFGNVKVVAGTCYTTIRNNYVTKFINEKLSQGVLLIE